MSVTSRRLCAVSVDLDEIPNYFQIHGLGSPDARAATLVYDVAVARLRDWAGTAAIPLTLFAIGADLARPEAASALKAAHLAGHEIANHSLDHRYDLVELDRAVIQAQVTGGADAVAGAVGVRPVGFRAPGYTVSDVLLDVLADLGVLYDSSVFPCPAYFGAKAAAIRAIALRGRTSHSVLGDPRVLLAPSRPYRVGVPYWRRGAGVLELPVQVTRGLRLPFIGTSVTIAGPVGARLLARACVGEPLVNLELHGIDVLDAADGLEPLRPHQPDVRVARARKLEALDAAITELRRAGYAFVTLREAAAAFA